MYFVTVVTVTYAAKNLLTKTVLMQDR